MKNILCFLVSILLGFSVNGQTISERAAVALNATAQVSPASITLSWRTVGSTTSFAIYRKLKTGTSWGSVIANPSASSSQWTDNSVTIGVNYEYKVVRVSNGVTGTGYISTGILVSAPEYRGKIILLVDNSISAQIVPELTQLIYDMRADGWGVLVSYVNPFATASSVKAEVVAQYNTDPANVKALYIVGHVPVPYSGNIAPDGHDDMRGARPVDGYYGDIDGVWTDNTVNVQLHNQKIWNVPGDGKFDQSNFPSSVELQVGRVDLYDMPVFSSDHAQLMRNYLNKAHAYKIGAWTPNVRSVLVDNLQWLGNPVAGSGFRLAPMVGLANPQPPAPLLNLSQYINNQSYLWTAHYGGGQQSVYDGVTTYSGVDGGCTSVQLATTVNSGGVFNMSLGSFYLDFDNKNNYLKAMIARGDGLTNCWAGIPAWYFHHMALGEPIGYSVRETMNNSGLYAPMTEGWQSSIGRTHVNLMGDPSLRSKMITPPTDLIISNVNGNLSFAWTHSNSNPAGYYIYRFNANGSITKLNGAPIVGNSWTSSIPYVSGVDHMVRAVKIENGFSGSYENLSLGAITTSPQTQQQLVKLDVKIFLEGPFNGVDMSDSLRASGYLPLSTPYTDMGYVQTNNTKNEVTPSSVMNIAGDFAIIDWILVELRSQQNTIFASRTGLLRKDGMIVDMDGISPLEFAVSPGSYHIAVKHRNHLGAMTFGQIALSNTSTFVDFTTGVLPLYGTDAMKPVGNRYCLWAGDPNFDGIIKYSGEQNDRDGILTAIGGIVPTNIVVGYRPEDINMDGKTVYTGAMNDRDIILSNIGGIIPTNTKTQQLP